MTLRARAVRHGFPTRASSAGRARRWSAGSRPIPRAGAAAALAAGRFGLGIVLYFAAEHEPALWAGLTLSGVLAAIAFVARGAAAGVSASRSARPPLAAGFAIATVKTARVAHPILQHSAWNVPLSGFVEVREEREQTDRIVVRVHSIEGRLRDAPERVRLSVKKRMAPPVGTFVEVKARLNRRRCARCGPAATTSRAISTSSASARPAS